MEKTPTTAVPHANRGATFAMKQYATFIALAFAISWLIWISAIRLGARSGVGEEILAFGSAGPAIAAIFLSRSRHKGSTASLTTRALWFTPLWAACWATYVVTDKMRSVTPTLSLRFHLTVAILTAIPAWIVSGAFSGDGGVRNLLRTLVVPQNWRWQAVAFLSFPALLLIPTAILRPLGVAVTSPRLSGTLLSFVAYGALTFLRNFFFTAVMEEPGWRGFLLPRLQQEAHATVPREAKERGVPTMARASACSGAFPPP